MKNLNATDPPSSSIKVDIFNSQYPIKPSENLTEDNIRDLAAYVDRMMRDVSRRGSHDKLSVAIMAALNIAAQLCEEQKRFANSVAEHAERLGEATVGDTTQEPLHAMSAFNSIRSMRR